MGLGGHGIRYNGDLADKGVHKEAEGDNSEICSRETNILTLYMCRADGGFQ